MIQKTVFISYRRTNLPWALAIYQNLTQHGFDVFFDYQSIRSGNFEQVIIENIKHRAHFLVILTPSALDRCNEPKDWLRREIETAIDEGRNIVPLIMEGFDFNSPKITEKLTDKLAVLPQYNGLRIHADYFEEGMARLCDKFLNVALKDIALPILTAAAEDTTKAEQIKAEQQPTITKEQLTAQELFERAYQYHTIEINIDEAIRSYQEAIRINPEFTYAYNNLGELFRETQQYTQAEKAYRTAIAINPDLAEAHCNLGNLLTTTNRPDQAEQAYRTAIAINPDDADTLNNLGVLLSDTNRPQEAEQTYRKAIAINADNANAHNNLGALLIETNRPVQAEQAYRKAIAINPHYAEAHYNLGLLLAGTNRPQEAEVAFRTAIAIKPDFAEFHNNLGYLLVDINRLVEAEQAYRRAIEINPDNVDTHYNLACLKSVTGEFEDAFDWLQQAWKKGLDDTAWAWEDSDLEPLRQHDPARFAQIVGEKPD